MSTWKPTRQGERCFNLFLFVNGKDPDDDRVYEIGVKIHQLAGDDRVKMVILEEAVTTDWPTTKRYKIPDCCIAVWNGKAIKGCLTGRTILAGRSMGTLEWLWKLIGAPESPMMCVTHIWNGAVRISDSITFDDTPMESHL